MGETGSDRGTRVPSWGRNRVLRVHRQSQRGTPHPRMVYAVCIFRHDVVKMAQWQNGDLVSRRESLKPAQRIKGSRARPLSSESGRGHARSRPTAPPAKIGSLAAIPSPRTAGGCPPHARGGVRPPAEASPHARGGDHAAPLRTQRAPDHRSTHLPHGAATEGCFSSLVHGWYSPPPWQSVCARSSAVHVPAIAGTTSFRAIRTYTLSSQERSV